ncbi:hypothetical protein MasN3_30160 [Massilia varians]|uniref:TehB/YeaR-like domain-containing protein n=1 Tax=Massilia varians TaxID=457921 RepID=A0ABN6TBD2_9BURK|nr:DUF1971 domain-containing protein [Massilia varians]BDT59522.1 hypothetical protein MasN3_30160 [Massilia varians]
MKDLPAGLEHYKSTPVFDQDSVPAGLRRAHSTAAGVWGRIVVHAGSLRYVIEAPDTEQHLLAPGKPGIVEPGVPHHVATEGPVRFCVEFYR